MVDLSIAMLVYQRVPFSDVFSSQVMAEKLPAAILKRFQDCLISGDPTTEEDQKIIADTLYEWVA